ncbi:hypothetical protein B9T11_07885 [Wohlfahrtiimonas chitiniclastica]|uniref:hypothetical protein n=1 Tax=Wohlfahrtiimonas chitiniclastica TaxID=400946 RepID=UPI000B986481|nr:hypothetical protein [Wohlfahrtiimonas chitiniclastica]MBS7819638.1 hypothetical protein [Wohlfahrtiimonas chitiniclastica]MBS7827355.1 hypothetical protein [Wohlfahrtiimonas chitiniclastica]MBS7837377.1 hypothetical protein [Wohlfahrtiimonas chitiniclastica]OYQ71635.1 hypothetical protein B9T13_02900 [Wohlfahrtiimonas chitiniclastica]OYQ76043.1 hypothetical protein B9T18_01430 [Wohlfahrtiimonas chitiniclastica]
MADNLKTAFEKYQFWAFTGMASILAGIVISSQADTNRRQEETQREIVAMSKQVAVVVVKLESYEMAQRSLQDEVKELSKRVGVLERDNGEIKQQLRQLSK